MIIKRLEMHNFGVYAGDNQFVFEGDKPQIISPKINIAVTTYYKGTALEGTTKKLEEYIDSAKENESQINYI